MSNPGPAVTNSIHPSNLSTNQALRVIAAQKAVSLATLGDVALPVINTTSFVPTSVIFANAVNGTATVSGIASVYLGIYNLPSQGNASSAILTAATTANTTTSYVTVSTASYPALQQTAQTLYLNVATATASGTVDVYVYGYDLSGPQQ